jgi:4-hydroxyphenylpyruvate dioxygenase
LTSPLNSQSELHEHLRLHGDGVKDIAFWVDDARAAWEYATNKGAKSAREPIEKSDDDGKVIIAAIETYGDTIHTFVDRTGYKGDFLPGFQPYNSKNQDKLGFKRFWTADDKDISTDYTSLRSVVVTNENERIKMPINRPAAGLRKSQIQEFVEYYSGPGVQHIAMDTKDIIKTVSQLSANGVEFLETPQSYYEELSDRVGEIDEDISELSRLGILVDRDEFGYMLQIFTKPVQDRPTLFYEIIQRKGSKSFGKGNFKALFESIEREQGKRGNL